MLFLEDIFDNRMIKHQFPSEPLSLCRPGKCPVRSWILAVVSCLRHTTYNTPNKEDGIKKSLVKLMFLFPVKISDFNHRIRHSVNCLSFGLIVMVSKISMIISPNVLNKAKINMFCPSSAPCRLNSVRPHEGQLMNSVLEIRMREASR